MAEEGLPLPEEATAAVRGANKVAIQMNRLKEANNKYKSLLKLAKERISTQQEEMEAVKGTNHIYYDYLQYTYRRS